MSHVKTMDKPNLKYALQLLQNGQTQDSERICLDLLRSQNNLADINHILALSYRAQGRLQEAESTIKRALSQSQDNATILNSYGLILLDQDAPQKAIKFLKRALTLNPSSFSAHANLGHAQRRLNMPRDAERSYRQALQLSPHLSDALVQLALLLRNEGRSEEIDFLPKLSLDALPQDPGLCLVYGLLALDSDTHDQAEVIFTYALKLQPASTELLINLGLSLARQDKKEAAESAYRRALEIDSSLSEAYINLADLWKYESPDRARTYLIEAVRLSPDDKSAHDMLGFACFMERDFDAAIESFNHALSVDPNYERAIFHRAGAHFLNGKFPEAWQDYNQRYGSSGIEESPIGDALSLWDGEDAPDSPLLVWTDQGMGDEILQLGLIADLYERNIPLIIVTSERLVSITERSFPGSTCVSREMLSIKGLSTTTPKMQCPAISTGSLLRNSFEDFPRRDAYLLANEKNSAAIRRNYLSQGYREPLIGLSWKSSNPKFGQQKSLTLDELSPALHVPGCTFVNLQYGDTDHDVSDLPESVQKRIFNDDDIDPLFSMDLFADQVRAVDLVITTSNTTAHMAGALGRPTWVLVPRMGPGWLWYWFDGSDHSPWYPNTRLFRQEDDGDWTNPISRIGVALLDFVKEYQSLTGN